MSDLIIVHRQKGEEILLNRDHIISGETIEGHARVTLISGAKVLLRETLRKLQGNR